LSQWQLLLDRAITGLNRLRARGQSVPDWVLGGGTALMIHAGHRLSKDIDVFFDDPQYLPMLSPRLGGEGIWRCDAFEEASNYLKLIYAEGEIDFIVAASITDIPMERKAIDVGDIRPGASHIIDIEHPVEIAIKKFNYRGGLLRARDIFDIAVVDSLFAVLLDDNLHRIAHLKLPIVERLSSISEKFCCNELAELPISAEWQSMTGACLKRAREIAKRIPEKQR
jgi:hypothetical protein